MKPFREFLLEGKALTRSPDPAEAASLLLQAERRLSDIITLPLNESSASFRFEHAYEAIREALQAFLSMEGYKSYSHEAIFSFAQEKHLAPEMDMLRADRYREIRNDINYRGKRATVTEAKEIIAFAERILPLLRKRFHRLYKK